MNNNKRTLNILIRDSINQEDIELFFSLIDKSLLGKGYLEPEYQHKTFLDLIKDYPTSTRESFLDIISSLKGYFMDEYDEFEKLHEENGGIIDGSDDSFYEDFGGWLIFRGIDILDNFFLLGSNYLINYINSLNLDLKDITYENFAYDILSEEERVERFSRFLKKYGYFN